MGMKTISLHSIVATVGTFNSGKSQWCHDNFQPWEILNPDSIRLEITGKPDNLFHEAIVWQQIHQRALTKIQQGQRAVIDAPNLKSSDREPFVELARSFGIPVYFVLFENTSDCFSDSGFESDILSKQKQMLLNSKKELARMNDPAQHTGSPGEFCSAKHEFKMDNTKLAAIGDVHGNYSALKKAVDHAIQNNEFLVFLGDLVDYGDHNLKCMKLAYDLVAENRAHMIWGNHERKISRWITCDWGNTYRGNLTESNLKTVREISGLVPERRKKFAAAWNALESYSTQHLRLGDWVFTHGAVHSSVWGLDSPVYRLRGEAGNMAYFGQIDKTHPNRPDGYPNRIWDWVETVPAGLNAVVGHDYLDRANHGLVVKSNSHGGNVYCIDCGSGKGGRLCSLHIDLTTNSACPKYWT
jgi:predicted kinase